MPEPLGTPQDVKQRLSCGLATVYRLAEQGVLPTVKIPGTNLVRFNMGKVEMLVQQWERNGRRRGRNGTTTA
jgi:excisionase family DNA binding protein